MANTELMLISTLVQNQALTEALRAGLSQESFVTAEGFETFEWLLQIWRNEHTVPSVERLRQRFASFPFCPTTDPVTSLVGDLLRLRAEEATRHALSEALANLDAGNDPREVLSYALPALRDAYGKRIASNGRFMASAFDQMWEQYHLVAQSGGMMGIPYPWHPLNEATGGMLPEQFIVVYGRPKNGKTWLAIYIMVCAYLAGYRVALFSKEMSVDDMMRRAAALLGRVDYDAFKKGRLSKEEADRLWSILADLKAHEQAGNAFFHVFSAHGSQGTTVDNIAAEVMHLQPDLLLVDGFYLLTDARTKIRSREWKQIGNVSGDLKGLAQQLKIPIIGTTQANRESNKGWGEDVSELAFADAIGQDADLVMRATLGQLENGSGVMLSFPGTRDSRVNPFVVHYNPGRNLEVAQESVDVVAWIRDARKKDAPAETADVKAKAEKRTPLFRR